jgi:molecular chaperone DnaK (HSP70)
MNEKIVQTAGRNQLGEFAPEFAHFNDDILFGENWNNQDIDLKTRCIITVVALISRGVTDSSLKYHLTNAKNHGVILFRTLSATLFSNLPQIKRRYSIKQLSAFSSRLFYEVPSLCYHIERCN